MQVYKAAKYIRLSYTDDKSNESNSVGNQRKLIEDFVSRHPEIELVSEKVDDGYSGVIFDRPAFKEMMDDIMEGKINCVIVKDLSRLGREYIETGRYMRRVFPAYGVRFIAINDNIDLLRGKVICGCCKHALHLANGTSYRCRFSSTIPSLDCYNIHIREKELNQLVYELLCKQFQVAFGIDSLADLRKVDTVAIRQADFDRQIFELQEEKRKLYEALVSGRIPLLEYKDQKEQISEKLLEVQNTKAVVMARLEAEQEERQHQRQQIDISRMLTESDGLTSELVDLLIDKIYVYPDKRVDIAFKIRDSFTTHD